MKRPALVETSLWSYTESYLYLIEEKKSGKKKKKIGRARVKCSALTGKVLKTEIWISKNKLRNTNKGNCIVDKMLQFHKQNPASSH